ncbi:MAG: PEP/pyruvate-binding domain-containing protein [Candidatus Aenigmatarchaeota archaeon]
MEYIKWLDELSKDSVNIAGGKGANLGEMTRLGLPVPPAFVITTNAFEKFIEINKIKDLIDNLIEECDVENTTQLLETSKKIKDLIISQEYPATIKNEIIEAYETLSFSEVGKELEIIKSGRDFALVAVRSSATAEDLPTASFAGQQASFLNVKGNKELLDSVKECFASLYEPRAIFYRAKQGFKHASIAVVVQKMVNSEKAGVMFTVNPATGDDEIIIEACWGLGETLVSGRVTPDIYVASKDGKLIDKKIGLKEIMRVRDLATDRTEELPVPRDKKGRQILTEEEIAKLAHYGVILENHYGKPQDIEFAIERNRIYIVQTRAITTVGKVEEIKVVGEPILKGLGVSPGIASGVVKIVKEMKDIDKVEKGDILVTTMTSPDLVPTMSKCAAIITDSGGQTCIAGDTFLLTPKGFATAKELYEKVMNREKVYILSFDSLESKPVWRRVKRTFRRVAKTVEVSVSQTGRIKNNSIRITPDHKIFTYEKRKLVKKELQKILDENLSVCVPFTLPDSECKISNEKLGYLVGSILSDGYWRVLKGKSGNLRKGCVKFTQKEEKPKIDFINTVTSYFEEIFGYGFTGHKEKTVNTEIRGKEVLGRASDYICNRLYPALMLEKIYQHLSSWCLFLDENTSLAFLAGLIDGDGTISNNRIQLYISDENILRAVVITCLNLSIIPQVTKNREIHNVQIVERVNEILERCKRVKVNLKERAVGTKFFAAGLILEGLENKVNWKGKIKPYIRKNLLIDRNKVEKRIVPMLDGKEKEEVKKLIDTNLSMLRIRKTGETFETEVFNFEVDTEEEINKNYVVFTKKYTPLLVSNCHAAIVSREMRIPCVVGTLAATKILKDGQEVTVDAYRGLIYPGIIEVERPEIVAPEEEEEEIKPTITQIKVNLAFPEGIEQIAKKVDGVGLLRIEHMILKSGKHPVKLVREGRKEEYIQILLDGIRPIAKTFYPKPVWVRTLDARTDELRHLEGGEEEIKEDNPMLGWHGIRRSLDEPELLKAEFEAIKKLHEEGLNNVHVMLPFIISVDEFRKAKEIALEAKLPKSCKLGIMVEVPSCALTIEEFCKEGIDFASIGSNDLTMLTLGVDRNNAKLSNLYSEMHPAVLRLIRETIKTCNKYDVESSICGEAPSNIPEMVEFLIECGIASISVNIDAIKRVREIVARSEKKLLEDLRRRE